jgi:hypothetical protein
VTRYPLTRRLTADGRINPFPSLCGPATWTER